MTPPTPLSADRCPPTTSADSTNSPSPPPQHMSPPRHHPAPPPMPSGPGLPCTPCYPGRFHAFPQPRPTLHPLAPLRPRLTPSASTPPPPSPRLPVHLQQGAHIRAGRLRQRVLQLELRQAPHPRTSLCEPAPTPFGRRRRRHRRRRRCHRWHPSRRRLL